MVIGSRKPKRVSKSPCKCRIGMGRGCPRKENGPRMPKKAQRGRNGPRKPVSNEMGQGSPSSMNANPMTMPGHCNQVKEEHTADPKEVQQARIK